jgi:hypothetical protein
VIEAAFGFMGDLGFDADPISISGREYVASFRGRGMAVYVSFEPGDDAFIVMVASGGSGREALDDPSRTPRLPELSRRFMSAVSPEARQAADAALRGIVANDEHEQQLVRAARDLRLVLPKYLSSIGLEPPHT